jgi:hypothetical protein
MAQVKLTKASATLLANLAEGLAEPLRGSKLHAVQAGVEALPVGMVPSMEDFDRLGFDSAQKSRFVFELLVQRFPELVGDRQRPGKAFATVVREIAGQAADGDQWTPGVQVDAALEQLTDRLLLEDPLGAETGRQYLNSTSVKTACGVQVANDCLTLELRAPNATAIRLVRSREDGIESWRLARKDEHPLASFDLRSLECLRDQLRPWFSAGTEDPILRLARRSQEAREADLYPALMSELDRLIQLKTSKRKSQLAPIEEALRIALGEARVGEAAKNQIDRVAGALHRSASSEE